MIFDLTSGTRDRKAQLAQLWIQPQICPISILKSDEPVVRL